jgi:hypothetical protein
VKVIVGVSVGDGVSVIVLVDEAVGVSVTVDVGSTIWYVVVEVVV